VIFLGRQRHLEAKLTNLRAATCPIFDYRLELAT
jgi:hypothetical protein